MNKQQFTKAIKLVKENSPKRKFAQSIELIINLKGLNLKNPDEAIDLWTELPHQKGKPIKIAALVGPELEEQAKQNCDFYVLQDNFSQYAGDKKKIKKLAAEYDFFIAQANLMADVAKTFGRYFGPRNKMPNPKAGCVVPPNANFAPLIEKLKKTVKVSAKTQPSIKLNIGTEQLADEQLAENATAIYNNVLHALPQETNNIRSVLIKLTMGSPVQITDKEIISKQSAARSSQSEVESKKQIHTKSEEQ
ncbi:50S ribosomal protein L1 [Candidatus Woesearchaeota archaeon CG10_big_fil_rev_8_21_14_0_10_37_12]|nr:MAG: 50S ribosomal protein L1 [Candidatus Woesearchaeota archaeon CG10_big_fil_rev_8_21_14_0_10_37_12]